MIAKSDADIRGLKNIGQIVSRCLQAMIEHAQPGMSTWELDQFGGRYLTAAGAISGPKAVYKFPGFTCISLNHEAAHGVPKKNKILRLGDMINIDVSAEAKGYFSDNGASFVLGEATTEDKKLLEATKKTMMSTVALCLPGTPLNVLGKNIETQAKLHGYTIIRNLGSHGVGRSLHEEPKFIAPYFDKKDLRTLKKGQVLTIEPFLSTGANFVDEEDDKWTLSIGHNLRVAQFEHSLLVTDQGPLILTLPD